MASGTGEARRCEKLLLKISSRPKKNRSIKAEKPRNSCSKWDMASFTGSKGPLRVAVCYAGAVMAERSASIRLFFVSTAADGGCPRA